MYAMVGFLAPCTQSRSFILTASHDHGMCDSLLETLTWTITINHATGVPSCRHVSSNGYSANDEHNYKKDVHAFNISIQP